MKKILLLVFLCLASFSLYAQYPITQNLGSDSTIIRLGSNYSGAIKGNVVLRGYYDTTAANLVRVAQYAGALIYTTSDSKVWKRNSTNTKWDSFATSAELSYVTGCYGLLNGGVVTWSGTGLIMNITAAYYVINCNYYNSEGSLSVTLDAADPSNPRIDVIAVDTSENIVVITGTPGVNPVKPQVNPTYQVELTEIYVPAGATTPQNYTYRTVYNENTEWTSGSELTTGTANFNSTVFPSVGTKNLRLTSGTIGHVYWDTIGAFYPNAYNSLSLRFSLASGSTNEIIPYIYLRENGVQVTYSLALDGFGYSSVTGINEYNVVTIPMSAFTFTSGSTFDGVGLYFGGIGAIVDVDYVQLQTGTNGGGVIGNYLEGIRRLAGSTDVEGLKNGVWQYLFTDSTGSGGGSSLTFTNGLTESGGTVGLGSALSYTLTPIYARSKTDGLGLNKRILITNDSTINISNSFRTHPTMLEVWSSLYDNRGDTQNVEYGNIVTIGRDRYFDQATTRYTEANPLRPMRNGALFATDQYLPTASKVYALPSIYSAGIGASIVSTVGLGKSGGYDIHIVDGDYYTKTPWTVNHSHVDYDKQGAGQTANKRSVKGIGFASYLASSISNSFVKSDVSFKNHSYISRHTDFWSEGSVCYPYYGSSKDSLLAITQYDTLVAFYSKAKRQPLNDVVNGYGFVQQGSQDLNWMEGKLRIGGSWPLYNNAGSEALGINGTIKITGGSPGAGKVLTSDANGLASWETPAGSTYTAGNGIRLDGTQFKWGDTLSENTTIEGGGNDLAFNNNNTFTVTSVFGVTSGRLDVTPSNTYLEGRNTSTGRNSAINTNSDTLYMYPNDGNFVIDSLKTITTTTGRKIMVHDTASGNVERIDPALISSKWTTSGNNISNNNSGNVGIGTISPTAMLDVDGTIRIRGGSPGINKVLTSDADGNASWQTPAGSITVGNYSTRMGLTPSNGTEFFQTDIGRDAPDGKYYYLNGKWHYMPLRPESLRQFWTDFQTVQQNGGYGDNGLIFWTGNSGAISYNNTTVPGVARFSTSTTTNGYSGFYGGALNNSGAWVNLNNGVAYFKAYVNIGTISDATNRYTFRIGLCNGLLGDFSSGVYFEYDESASANWRIKTANFTTRTTTTTSTAVATGWHTLEILVNAAGTSVEYWLNGNSLGTITTNIPSSGNGLNPSMIMIKSAGTSARYIDIDYVKAWQRLSTEIQ